MDVGVIFQMVPGLTGPINREQGRGKHLFQAKFHNKRPELTPSELPHDEHGVAEGVSVRGKQGFRMLG